MRRELDDQDRVLRGEPDQHHEADLEVDVVGHAAHEDEHQRAEQPERNREQYRDRQRPPLVIRREDEEHHDDGERERERRRRADALLLERLAGP